MDRYTNQYHKAYMNIAVKWQQVPNYYHNYIPQERCDRNGFVAE